MVATKRFSFLSDAMIIGRAIRMARSAPGDQARNLYELFPDSVLMTERTHFHNQGYWLRPEDTLDDAGENLALLVADQAGFREGDRVLDAGFGYGDQDFLWLRRYGLASVTGLNVTPRHVRFAQERARAEGLTGQLDFRQGSATEMDVTPGSFDRVVAVESAFHFITRDKFFQQAYQALRPGGVLATADVIPLNAAEAARERKSGLFSFAYPDENRYDGEEYLARLKGTGFTNVRLDSIRDHVFDRWIEYTAWKMDDPAFQAGISRLSYRLLHSTMTDTERMHRDVAGLDYVIAVAEKPA